MTRRDMLPGTLDFLILSTLEAGSLHGYGIARRIEERSQAVLQVGQGSLYPALYRLEKSGKIRSSAGISETGRQVKIFELTRAGRDALLQEAKSWSSFRNAVERVVGGPS